MTDDQTPGPHDDAAEREAAGHEPTGREPETADDATRHQPEGQDGEAAAPQGPSADAQPPTTRPTEVQPTAAAAADESAASREADAAPSTGAGTRLVPWTHRPTTSQGAAGPAAASSAGAAGAAAGATSETHDDPDDDLDDEPGRRRLRPAVILAVVGGAAVVAVVLGTVLAFTDGSPLASGAPAATSEPASTTSTSARPSSTPTPSATPTTSPSPSPSPSPRAATPPPEEAAVEAPYITPIPTGTVVAEADVTSPKGSISFHYRVVATGDGSYTTEWSNFTSSLPVTIQASFFEITPSVGDGITATGDGATLLGGPTTTPASITSTLTIGQPSYLRNLVVSTAEAPADAPVEIGTGKILAVADVAWNVPARDTNIAAADGGVAAFANGTVTASTASGSPKRYLVSGGDLTGAVAARFGISVSALIYLNQGLEVLDDEQRLIEGTTLILDPDSL